MGMTATLSRPQQIVSRQTCQTLWINAGIYTIRNNVSRNATKLNATNYLITEDPSLMFSIVKVAHDQTKPGSLLARPRGRLDEKPWEQGCPSTDTDKLSKVQQVVDAPKINGYTNQFIRSCQNTTVSTNQSQTSRGFVT